MRASPINIPTNCIIIPIGVCHYVTKSHEVGHKMAKPVFIIVVVVFIFIYCSMFDRYNYFDEKQCVLVTVQNDKHGLKSR